MLATNQMKTMAIVKRYRRMHINFKLLNKGEMARRDGEGSRDYNNRMSVCPLEVRPDEHPDLQSSYSIGCSLISVL